MPSSPVPPAARQRACLSAAASAHAQAQAARCGGAHRGRRSRRGRCPIASSRSPCRCPPPAPPRCGCPPARAGRSPR
eukprot:scaffold1355_cov336-Prasinococcus_capsulatus_cf.AAC.2